MANFHSELDPPKRNLIVGHCHAWYLKNFTENEYICVNCDAEMVGAKNLHGAPDCKLQIIARNWLPQKDPHYKVA